MNMSENGPNREWLLRYVAGELPEDETRAADERFFSHDEFAGAVEEQYHDLLDAYAAGEITGSDRERVERIFLSQPEQQRQLRILAAMQARPERASEAVRSGTRIRFRSFWPMAISAGVLSFAIAILAFQHNSRLRAIADRNAPVSSVATEPPGNETGPVQPAPESAFTILLLPNVSRGAEDTRTFAIPEKAGRVVFQVVLPPGQDGSEFAVRLQANGQGEPHVFSGLTAKMIEKQKYVEFSIPPDQLPAAKYELNISGSGSSGAPIEQFELSVTYPAHH
jgi:anti-sigma factor RsiW